VLGWQPEERYDLVTSHFLQLPEQQRRGVFAQLAAAVAPGGTLLLVGHDVSLMEGREQGPHTPDMFFTAQEVAATLEPQEWDVVVAEARSRPGQSYEAELPTVVDAVVVARRRS
jgi:hypothetical protein